MTSTETSQQLLQEFLSYPLNTTDDIFARFKSLPGAIFDQGTNPLERYVCIPGSRENKIVLIAHADTIWDDAYGWPMQTTVIFEDGIFKSGNPECGIGADDRAGCAMLWALRNSGHTILLVSGEERGKWGAKYLRKSNPELFRMLNNHQFMIELDWRGTGTCLFNQVPNSNRFRKYIADVLGFQDAKTSGGCDLEIMCHKICGVNIGVGYDYWHSVAECLSLADWESTLACVNRFLEISHPRFLISIPKKIRHFFARIKGKIVKLLKR